MTREEAIAYFKDMNECTYGDVEPIQMAIKALAQEPCEDAISRQAVLAIAGDSCLDLDSYEDTKDFCDEINELPPVTPQEPFKPMVEIDLYSVVKQKYIEREVLDKIRADVINIADGRRSIPVRSVINILDKYKAESEDKE